MRIGIVGSGIAGLVAAREICADHDVTVLEADDHVGGHAHTVDVEVAGRTHAIDTGFVVFNRRTYPGFTALLERDGVASQPSDMSFSARDEASGVEYCGSSLSRLFAQRRNLVRPAFLRMVRDILRFYREAPALLEDGDDALPLGDYLRRNGYSRAFVQWHMIPMAGAVWSASGDAVERFPARTLVRFFANHGFLQLRGRPPWLTVTGGSREYVRRLVRPFEDRIRLRTPATRVRRHPDRVEVVTGAGEVLRFDQVVLACHADQTLRLLEDASPKEREILGAFRTQENDLLLHTDTSVMPRRRRAWASWNVHVSGTSRDRVAVTYLSNSLQGIPGPPWILITLNRPEAVDPARVLRRFTYRHPQFTVEAIRAQSRWTEISGHRRTHFAGAWWRYGFHEDGVQSGLAVARRIREGTAA